MTDINVSQQQEVTVIRLSGELTSLAMAEVERAFVMTTTAAERVVVDLTGVSMITTPGITMLVAADRNLRRRKGRFVLCGLKGNVKEVLLERCRLDTVFDIQADVAAAVAEARG